MKKIILSALIFSSLAGSAQAEVNVLLYKHYTVDDATWQNLATSNNNSITGVVAVPTPVITEPVAPALVAPTPVVPELPAESNSPFDYGEDWDWDTLSEGRIFNKDGRVVNEKTGRIIWGETKKYDNGKLKDKYK